MADIICRWRNGTPKTVMELANSLPHHVMPVSEFRKAMTTKWGGDFFHTPYQLACQLGLYCEADDGFYYPRFDHDITEAEAHRYLEMWINHYYIPNPDVAKDGFKDLECPTYLIKSLYDYVVTHPGCDYASAYKALFHDDAKNNDDIVRNYINRYSKVLHFSKEGKLSTTDYNAKKVFCFMDRNNKKEFFDTFELENEVSLMDSYLKKNVDDKKEMFYQYLKSTGLAESSCKQYAFTHPFHDEVIKIIQDNASKTSLFDVIDGWMVQKIHKLVCQLPGNKKQGNAWSATVSNYKNFLDYLEVGGMDLVNEEEVQIPVGEVVKESTNVVDFFSFAVKTILNFDSNFERSKAALRKNSVTVGFKYCPFGKKAEVQEQVTDPRRLDDCDSTIKWKYEDEEYYFLKEQSSNSLATFAENINTIYKDRYFIEIADGRYRLYELNNSDITKHNSDNDTHESLVFIQSAQQIIYYGAPGTGKSHTIKKKEDAGLACIRTTFHPDSDYATFVGCYKPHRIKEGERKGEITYEFVEQALLEAYKMAWLHPDQETALVIEEINRGNCAQVFGDIFQLLDRDEDGWSTYPIKADTDICDHLEALALPGYNETMMAHFGKDKGGYRFMALPPNLSILATMNTSDQSLFPIDSAFKRRWDWKYVPISQGCDKEGNLLAWTIESDAADKDWWHFLMSINGIIHSVTKSEDKELGFFFTKADAQGVISAEKFVNKVVFYLWTDVFKTYGFRSDIFDKDPDGKEKLAFKDFYKKDGSVNQKTVKIFIENVRKHLPKDEEPKVEEPKVEETNHDNNTEE